MSRYMISDWCRTLYIIVYRAPQLVIYSVDRHTNKEPELLTNMARKQAAETPKLYTAV